MRGLIYVGVGGWSYDPWRGSFYPHDLPRKDELAYMSERLTSIEINGTFYRTQPRTSFIKWREATPDGFVFSVKAPRYATMRKSPDEAQESIARFFDSGVMELREKLGPILWQFPASRQFDADFFDAFLGLMPKEAEGSALRHAIDARHPSVVCAEYVELARKHGVAIVLAGDSKFPLITDVTADFVYARIMGTQKDELEGYDESALDAWATRASIWAAGDAPADLPRVTKARPKKEPRDVFVYVIRGAKERNPAAAMALIRRIDDNDMDVSRSRRSIC